MPTPFGAKSFSISKLRNIILVCLVAGVASYTAVMFSLAQRLSERFGPQVRSDLEWRVQRGAQELARAADLGLAIGDADLVRRAFGAYAKSTDVQAIVAVDGAGKTVTEHGRPPRADLFAGEPGAIRTGPGYLVSWGEAQIEGAKVGKVAVVVSTNRLREAQELLDRSSNTTLTGGLGALLLGSVIVCFFTWAVALRDGQLSDYAKNLERKVDERTRELDQRNAGMSLVLDNVAQGFISIDLHSKMTSERSAIVDRWFGTPPVDGTLSEYLAPHSVSFVAQLEMGLAELRDGVMPLALLLYQLPSRFGVGERTFEASYTAIGSGEPPERLLVIISDVTEHIGRERAEREQKELTSLFRNIVDDRAGVEEFLTEAAHLVGALRDESQAVVQQRLVHTLKGTCAMFGLETFAELAHRIESQLIESGTALDAAQRAELVAAWKHTIARVGWLLGGASSNLVQIDVGELDALSERARAGIGPNEIAATLAEWKREPIRRRLERLARQAKAVALRLNKPEPKIEIEDHGIRLDGDSLNPLWGVMVHVIRNALDHGIEEPQSRVSAGKPASGTIALTAHRREGKLIVGVRDDGRGVDWERVRARAAAHGLAHETHEELIEAIFSDGVTTKEEVTDVSGRGVGLAALRQVVRALDGTIEVESEPQRGTVFRFLFDERRVGRIAALNERRARASLLPRFC